MTYSFFTYTNKKNVTSKYIFGIIFRSNINIFDLKIYILVPNIYYAQRAIVKSCMSKINKFIIDLETKQNGGNKIFSLHSDIITDSQKL